MALEHLRAGAVRLIRIGGGPGTGKTTLAQALSENNGVQAVSTDAVRRQLQAQGFISGDTGTLDSGLYSAQNVSTVYETVLQRAWTLLMHGQSVILDGTWRDPFRQEQACRLAHETHCLLYEIECHLPLSTAQDRITHRRNTLSERHARNCGGIQR
ncbi:AAA family ATPase [Mycobacteroides chelonae]|uniref:AAA family ATPase n=1 Tax=Mycobacteroides chelonae TaxID=1774 RepID=UPI001F2BBF1E|nr:AAA family ATPase [Mycobacteroides chelonae]